MAGSPMLQVLLMGIAHLTDKSCGFILVFVAILYEHLIVVEKVHILLSPLYPPTKSDLAFEVASTYGIPVISYADGNGNQLYLFVIFNDFLMLPNMMIKRIISNSISQQTQVDIHTSSKI